MNKIIINSFKEKVKEIFGENLIFGFIGGSFARSKSRKNSDIDMFICTKRYNKYKYKNFINWYLKIHKDYGFNPDKKFFAEITTIKRLNKAFDFAENIKPSFLINNIKIYNALVWAGLIIGKRVGFIGQKKVFINRKIKATKVINLWHKKLLKELKIYLPNDFLKRVVKYEKK